ncbi:MAG TPA: fibrillarin-like rRNA/tRNA 2'-O-methyltransferase [Thermoplasmata archaeon]|nr:fibrillarin-like rRNA/tRNA 2'-O-methyltransferase [Thermoplasmata archaeon]
MRTARPFTPDSRAPRLARALAGDRTELFTEAVGAPPPVYGERWVHAERADYRAFEPGRSKLAAGIVRGWAGPIPGLGERWLYLGAATGTTASHVADLVGPNGRVYAVERSPRPFARLLALAERWSPLLPLLADARDPRTYLDRVPMVDGLYADIAQPDQIAIVRSNAELILGGAAPSIIVALKTASMGRDLSPADHLAAAERELGRDVRLVPAVRLDPFHKGHFLIGGTLGPGAAAPSSRRPVRLSRAPRPGRRRS